MLVSVWLELAEQYLQSVVLEFSLQSQTYVTTHNILGIGWKPSVVGWSDSRWVRCTFMVSSDYDPELVLWLLVGSMLLHFWVHITYLTEEEAYGICWKDGTHQTGNGLVYKCLDFRCWTCQPPSPKVLPGHVVNSSSPAPVLNCTHGGLDFQRHKALCVLYSWGNLCSFAEMVSNK